MGSTLSEELKLKIVELLKQNNLSDTINTFLQESSLNSNKLTNKLSTNPIKDYKKITSLISESTDKYKAEFSLLLYPVFIYTLIELYSNDLISEANEFYSLFADDHLSLHYEDINAIKFVRNKEAFNANQLLTWFRQNKYGLIMSKETYSYIKYILTKNNLHGILHKLETYLSIDVVEDTPRTLQAVQQTIGSFIGEPPREINKQKIFCGLLKEPEVVISLSTNNSNSANNENLAPNSINKSMPEDDPSQLNSDKKKKTRKDGYLLKKAKTDPMGPPQNRIPLPELKESDKMLRILVAQEALKRYKINGESLPSVCCYTVLNAKFSVTSAIISEDSAILAIGFSDGIIKIFALTPQKLRGMKSAWELKQLDINEEDVLNKIMDEKNVSDVKILCGHTESITALSLSHDKMFLLSSSIDATIRLWSLLVFKNIVCFKGHLLPVWDVQFCPLGYYFASGGADKTLRFWATDQSTCLRLMVGHQSDVDVIKFHPNCNYIASGSSDRTVRLWDCLNGLCVRIFTGHKNPITALTFSLNGRHLISGGKDGKIYVWDLQLGHLVTILRHHFAAIYAFAFDRDGVCLTSGGADCMLSFWDYKRISQTNERSCLYISSGTTENTAATLPSETLQNENLNETSTPNPEKSYLMKSVKTKNSIILAIHYTWRNLAITLTEFCMPTNS